MLPTNLPSPHQPATTSNRKKKKNEKIIAYYYLLVHALLHLDNTCTLLDNHDQIPLYKYVHNTRTFYPFHTFNPFFTHSFIVKMVNDMLKIYNITKLIITYIEFLISILHSDKCWLWFRIEVVSTATNQTEKNYYRNVRKISNHIRDYNNKSSAHYTTRWWVFLTKINNFTRAMAIITNKVKIFLAIQVD